jgi:hypothetical protein
MDGAVAPWVVALLVCLWGGLRSVRDIVNGHRSERWPTVSGEVVHAFARNWFGKYAPVVRYTYQYRDAQFNGSRLAFAPILIPSKSSVEALLRQFQPGQEVLVRVRPDRPRVSVLRAGSRVQSWIGTIGSCAFGIYCLYRIVSG